MGSQSAPVHLDDHVGAMEDDDNKEEEEKEEEELGEDDATKARGSGAAATMSGKSVLENLGFVKK